MTCSNPSNDVPSNNVFKELEKFGKFHYFQYFLVCLPLCVVTMSLSNYIFVAEIEKHRCIVPECEYANSSAPYPLPDWWPLESKDPRYYRPVLDLEIYEANDVCTNTSFIPKKWVRCKKFMYETNNSIYAEFDLGSETWKATLVGSMHNTGMIASMMVAGWISDKIGRKPALIIYSVGGFVGISKSFVSNYYIYLGIEFIESFLSSGILTVAVVLLIEHGGDKKRVIAGVIFSYATYFGDVFLAFLAMGVKYWKSIILISYSPMILFIFYIFLLKESTRWQMLRGKIDDAKKTFKGMAKMNKLNVTAEEIDKISNTDLGEILNIEVQEEKESIREILGSKEIMKRLIVTSFCFFSSGFIYLGLNVEAVLLPGNKYTNYILSTLTSFPGELLAFYTFIKYGRKITLQCGYFACAIFVMAQAFVPNYWLWVKLALFLLGKFGVVVSFTGIFTYSLELFPTSTRGSLLGCGNTACRIGSMLAPMTPLLASQLEILPSILFSAAAVFAGLLLTFTPETRTLPMFDTIDQVEAYAREQRAKTDKESGKAKEMNLGCDSWKSSLVGSVHNAGMIVSMMFTGWIADKIGRKPTTIICSIGGAVGIFKIFITNFYAYIVVEFLESVLASGLYTVAIVLMIELGGETKRVMAGVIFSYAVYVGEVAFAFSAMGLKHWKSLILFVYSPLILFLSYTLLLRESTRWQMLRGRMEPAKDTFKMIAKRNKLDMDEKDIEDTTDEEIRNYFNVETQKEKETIGDLMASKEIMILLAVSSFCFFTSSFLYYGSMVHSVLLPGDKYTNFVLAAIASFPGDMIAFYTFNKFGRRITLQCGYISSAVFLIAQQFVPDSISWLKIVLFLLGKLGVVVCFTGIYTYSLELFPTSVRGSLIGCGNTAARVGSMLAPLTPLLIMSLTALPTILFSVTAVLAALLVCFTPETKEMPMFDTIAQISSYKAKDTEGA